MIRLMIRVPLILVVLCATLALSVPASAAAGDLDPSYGVDGTAVASYVGEAIVEDMVATPGGGVVLAGTTWEPGGVGDYRFAITRFDASGALDRTFSINGKQAVRFGTKYRPQSAGAEAVAVRDDGAVYAAGAVGLGRVGVVRLLPDGHPDPSFGRRGKVSFASGNVTATVGGLDVDPDGGVTVSYVHIVQTTTDDESLGITRLAPDGSRDPTFGTDGKGTTLVPTTGEMYPSGLIVRSDGSIIAVAELNWRFAMVALTPTGDPTTAFGGDGIFRMAGPSRSFVGDVAIAPSGKILATGTSLHDGVFVLRLNSDLTFDPSFGADGVVMLGTATMGSDVAAAPGGKVWATGYWSEGDLGRATLFRLDPTGARDGSFSGNGAMHIPVPADTDAALLSLVPTTDGSVIAGGSSYNLNDGDSTMHAVRILGS